MKNKDTLQEDAWTVLIIVLLIIILPFCLLYLVFKLLATPFDYIKYKRSLYQQDFPRKYKWLSEPHADNDPYTAIKKHNWPIEYIKWHEDYDINGYFVYNDILLDFSEPLFFDKKKGLWLFWLHENGDDEISENDESDEDIDCHNTDNCLTIEETKEFILEEFRSNIPGRQCKQVVFFYQRKNAAKNNKDRSLDTIREPDDFVIYKKGELAEAIRNFIDTH